MKPGDLVVPKGILVHFYNDEKLFEWEYLDKNICAILDIRKKDLSGRKENISKVLTSTGVFWVYLNDLEKLNELN